MGVKSKAVKTCVRTATEQPGPAWGFPTIGLGCPLCWGASLRAESAHQHVSRQDSPAGPHSRHIHVQATPTWNTPAPTSAMTMTQPGTPFRYTLTRQELVGASTAIHTPRHHVGPRGAHTHLCPARLSGNGHPWRLWPDGLSACSVPGRLLGLSGALGPGRQAGHCQFLGAQPRTPQTGFQTSHSAARVGVGKY